MIQEIDLLNQIHQNADMGQDSIRHIMDLSSDSNFLHVLNKQMEEYQNVCQKSGEMLCSYNKAPADAKPMAKLMSHISSQLKTINDCSTSKLAEMVIEGSTMGVTSLTKQINAYSGQDRQIAEFANAQLKTEEANITEMKKFL